MSSGILRIFFLEFHLNYVLEFRIDGISSCRISQIWNSVPTENRGIGNSVFRRYRIFTEIHKSRIPPGFLTEKWTLSSYCLVVSVFRKVFTRITPTPSTLFRICDKCRCLLLDKSLLCSRQNFHVERDLSTPGLEGVSSAHFNHNGSLLIFANNKGIELLNLELTPIYLFSRLPNSRRVIRSRVEI